MMVLGSAPCANRRATGDERRRSSCLRLHILTTERRCSRSPSVSGPGHGSSSQSVHTSSSLLGEQGCSGVDSASIVTHDC
jgi:hypothetical protein